MATRLASGLTASALLAFALHGLVLWVWHAPPLWDGAGTLTPLEDQQLAGLIMWVPGGVVLLAAALGLVAAMLRDAERRTTRRPRLPAPRAAAVLAYTLR